LGKIHRVPGLRGLQPKPGERTIQKETRNKKLRLGFIRPEVQPRDDRDVTQKMAAN
jgi:hypothetical protein